MRKLSTPSALQWFTLANYKDDTSIFTITAYHNLHINMPRSGGKRGPKAASSTTVAANASKPTSTNAGDNIPSPFTSLPQASSLYVFAKTLPRDHIYTVNLDNNPATLKKRVFVVPLLMNIVITLLLCWRLYFAVPVYLQQIITVFGWQTSFSVKPQDMGAGDILGTISGRTGLLMIDYFIFGVIGRWPWEFFVGSKYGRYFGPIAWRFALGFQSREVVVRKGRKWDENILRQPEDNDSDPRGLAGRKAVPPWTREQELTVRAKLEGAMGLTYTKKTGYLLLDKDWDLDFKAMVDAHDLIEQGKLKETDLSHVALVPFGDQWLAWYPHKEETNGSAEKTAERDAKLENFKAKLTKIGCEEIFYRWIEIVQFESAQPDGFTKTWKADAVNELKSMLKSKGKDDETFWTDVGGLDGVPGLDNTG